ncbi:MAG: hypothetical protein LVQ97_00450 [Candidatus Micrarchaeales archaeon]|jgi:hypothetical protein|uniref:Uncharacterized protein n=1 Tax=Candidatus Micrarchaeum acidiphilum ARMAN-2 TaxID=425595 RepID=C7DHH2_MICA2|nr:MAG: hypothetical protein UNLARM2_0516 [Candidatus Micrarchaeum acidiphilum ARMAN-2]MCW6160643.1 hypothetical protein [Candidatus Micrarchaeales archaeon]
MGITARAQISIEFMVYMAVALSSLAAAVYAYSAYSSRYSSEAGQAYLNSLFAKLDYHMQYPDSVFSAYVPKSICTAVANGSSIAIGKSVFRPDYNLEISSSVCAGSGSTEELNLSYDYNGTYTLQGASP